VRARAAGWAAALAVAAGALVGAGGVRAAAPTPAVRSEYLVLTRSGPAAVTVFEDLSLTAPPRTWWNFPLPYGARDVHAQIGRLRKVGDGVQIAPGTRTAAVVMRLAAPLGAAFVERADLGVGRVVVLAGPGVYPGVNTGLTLHGATRLHNETFRVFSGGAQGPGASLHFGLSVGQPGIPWADLVSVVLALWLAFGAALAVMGLRRLAAPA
jgi:hypothetical protein